MAEYYPIVVMNGSFTITNSGTAPTPCKVVIIPKVDMSNITITGLSKEQIIVYNVEANQEIIIDGEIGDFTIDGVSMFDQYEGWEFPKLQPGVNEISISNYNQLSIAIEFQARYI